MAETRRQILGITRRIPACVISYFRELLSGDTGGLQVSFTMANLKAIPKGLNPEETLALVKRMSTFYENGLPVPKSLQAKEVPEQIVNIRRAAEEIRKFKSLCEYDELPEELAVLADRMLSSQVIDDRLAENCFKETLLPQIATACRNLVTGGSQRVATAERKLSEANASPEAHIDNPESTSPQSKSTNPEVTDEDDPEYSEDKSGHETQEDQCVEMNTAEDERVIPIGRSSTARKSKRTFTPDDDAHTSADALYAYDAENVETVDALAKEWLPIGWHLIQGTYETFVQQDDRWKCVQSKADLVLTEIPSHENNEDWIKHLVIHMGRAMKLTGVCHMFCSHLQFAKVYTAAIQEGMQMMPYPMLYVWDSTKIRKRTLSQHPQEGGRCAAVFWRSPDKNTKHHYSPIRKYPNSQTPPWTNFVTNVQPPSESLATIDGIQLKVQVLTQDLMKFILEQWCTPAGFCYNPRSGAMSAGLACLISEFST